METSAATRPISRPAGPARSGVLLRLASDERLVEHARAGSEAAFEVLYDRHHRGILGFCRHMLGSVEEAEDALQHTFMAAYRDLLGSDKAIHLRPWLYTIARNRCYTILRARRDRPMGEADEPSTENLSIAVQRRQDLRDMLSDLSGLPDDQRAALVLSELGAVSHEDIATVLDVPRDKVKALVFQGRSSLIASRKARETPCDEIREQLASLRGGSLRRTTLRRHLRECPGCRQFRAELTSQRRALAIVLPVLPTAGLKETALGATFGTGSAGGGAAVAASTAAMGGSTLAAKALVAVALVGGGTTAGVTAVHDTKPPKVTRAGAHSSSAARPSVPAPAAPRATGAAPATGRADEGERSATRDHRTRTPTRAGGRHAVRAHGRAGAPGQLKSEPAKRVKKVKTLRSAPRAESRPAKPERARPQAKVPARIKPPPAVRPVPVAPRARPKPVKRAAPPAALAAPTPAPSPAAAPAAPEHTGAKKLK